MDEEEIKMDDGVARFFTRLGGGGGGGGRIFLFIDLWVAQPCLGDPE